MGLSRSLSANDTWELKVVHPTWATNPTNTTIGMILYFKVR